MLKISNIEDITKEEIPALINRIEPILEKRRQLHNRYSRKADNRTVLWSKDNKNTKITFEKFLTDLATGYTAGKPIYSVNDTQDEERKNLIKKLLDRELGDDDYKQSMEIIVKYITDYNDDGAQTYELFHNLFELTGCYQVLYEDEDNEIRYVNYDPLQTVAVWGYELPTEDHLKGLVRKWDEETLNGTIIKKVEITDKNGTRTYAMNNMTQKVKEEDNDNHNWGQVPAIAIESDFALFEPCEDLIKAYEQLIQNTRNIYQYNDDAILKVVGYTPMNEPVIQDDNGNLINNPEYETEVEAIKKMGVFFTPDGNGDIGWVIKQVDANGIESVLKIYIDLIFQLSGIPNTSDLAFNSTDLNASAIDRKFYIMNMATTNAVKQIKRMLLKRWELIFERINIKKNTKFDYRDIEIEIPKNLPANDDEKIDSLLKLKDTISNQTIIEKLGYNYKSEKSKMDEEAEENFENNMNNIMSFKGEQNDNIESMDNGTDNNVNNTDNNTTKGEKEE